MRYVRFAHDGEVAYGEQVDTEIHELSGMPFDGGRRSGRVFDEGEVRLLAPCAPTKVVAVGRNFASHLHGRATPTEPGLFAKMPTSIIGPGDDIVLPPDAQEVHYEGELVVVIGRRTHRISAGEAADHVLGVTAGNDVSERRWQREDLQWFRAKGADTFGPLGPAIVTDLEYADLLIQTRHNGVVVQSERSRDLIFPIDEIVAYVSRYVTLDPGDVVYTGTPGTTSPMSPGDLIEVEVEGVGTLRNEVVGG